MTDKISQSQVFKVYLILTVQLQDPLDLPLYQTFSQVLAKNNKIIDFKQINKISFLKIQIQYKQMPKKLYKTCVHTNFVK